jgi:hypothetical protein
MKNNLKKLLKGLFYGIGGLATGALIIAAALVIITILTLIMDYIMYVSFVQVILTIIIATLLLIFTYTLGLGIFTVFVDWIKSKIKKN